MTRPTNAITFGAFRLDLDEVRLSKGEAPVPLQPRPLAVLSYLAARPGEVVSRDEIIARLWDGTAVTKAVLKVAVRAIREALDDDATSPRYIETVGRDGYRFIGSGATVPANGTGAEEGAPRLVGRAAELATLHGLLARAEGGTRAMVVVSGEAGIGKTTLIERFADELRRLPEVWVARGQCLEQYGEGEPYLPVLDAIGRLVREESGRELVQVLRRHAPSWASQLPALATRGGNRRPSAAAGGPTRMLRELSDALEVFTRDRTLVLLLEDLHWSDRATVDLLAYVARRREPARLLVIGSARSAELIIHQHPLRGFLQELRASGQCEELALELLSPADVTTYCAGRFPGLPGDKLRRVAARIHERTEGNALFMVNMLNDLMGQGLLTRREGRWEVEGSIDDVAERVPIGLQELIGRRIEGLTPAAQRTLEAASVAGDPFTVASVAAALGDPVEAVEDACEALAAEGTMIADAGASEWPDGTISGRYRFLHALYRHVLYQGISEARRVRLHRAIGLREEAGLGRRAVEHAAQLAMHFSRGRDRARALEYHERAGFAALAQQAPHEAVRHCGAALAALAEADGVPDRPARELRLVVTRATLHMATRGYGAPETERDFARAREICAELRGTPDVYPVLRGLVSYHQVRGELALAHELDDEMLAHAARADAPPELRVQAHYGAGTTIFHEGALGEAAVHLEAARAGYDPAQHTTHARVYGGYDPGVACTMWLVWTLALQGRLEEAAALDATALAQARRLPDAFTLAWACYAAGVSRQVFSDWAASEALAAEAMRLAEENGFPYVLGLATTTCGWGQLMQGRATEGVALLRRGIAAVEATGAGLMRPTYLGMLAVAEVLQGDRAAAARCYDEALAECERSGERVHLAAILIGKSHVLSGGGPGGRSSRAALAEAEDCLRRALEVARAQGARLLELRASVALARHWDKQGRSGEGREQLRAVHEWFAPQAAIAPELVAARQLLGS